MAKAAFLPERVFIEESVLTLPQTRRILRRLPRVPREVISDSSAVVSELDETRDAVGEGKRFLLLARQKGAFIKPCPCSPGHVGCGYWIINLDLNCPLDCSYCILQLYLSNPLVTIHVNGDDLLGELDEFLSRFQGRRLRIGTGELGDSLALDHLTGNAAGLVEYFRERESATLELKTKTTNVGGLMSIKPAENVVVSWSLNSFAVAREEEVGAPSIEERFEAAKRIASHGFPVGFHFDPLILYPEWEVGYAEVVVKMLVTVPPSRIAWISLGSLRLPPRLKPLIKARFPSSRILDQELVPGKDGKLRYFRPLRVRLYEKMLELIRDAGGERIPVYLCMESSEVWQDLKKKGKSVSGVRFSPR